MCSFCYLTWWQCSHQKCLEICLLFRYVLTGNTMYYCPCILFIIISCLYQHCTVIAAWNGWFRKILRERHKTKRIHVSKQRFDGLFSMLKIGETFCWKWNTDVWQNCVSFFFLLWLVIKYKRENPLTVFLHALVWLITLYCMKGCVTYYVMGLCRV